MIQPRVPNTEYKVLLVRGEAKLITNSKYGFKSSAQDIFDFAERVAAKLKREYPETMNDYIIRADIFEVDGKLKLNEFESFDADILKETTHSRTKRKYIHDGSIRNWSDNDTLKFIRRFWLEKLRELIQTVLTTIE